jgi:hypothetical protein
MTLALPLVHRPDRNYTCAVSFRLANRFLILFENSLTNWTR